MITAAEQEIIAVEEEVEIVVDPENSVDPEIEASENTPGVTDEIDADEIVVTIGDETPEEEHKDAPAWVKEVRKKNREQQKRIKELEGQVAKTAETKPVVLEAKPTLASVDYDSAKFETSLEQWYEKKRTVDAQAAEAETVKAEQDKSWNAKLEGYQKAKVSMKVKDFDDAESAAKDLFDETQQGIILAGADNPALLIYALGKNEKKSKELAAIKDRVQFAFAVARMELQVKTTNKKTIPAPEGKITGTGGMAVGASDATLKQLEAEADKTGDRTKVAAYKRKIKNSK